jgi:CBS domain containing-hemolysin-like protein
LWTIGYILAGVTGRVFAEPLLDAVWPATGVIRSLAWPLTYGAHRVDRLFERLAGSNESTPRPTSVEVEIPSDPDEESEDVEAELPEEARELLRRAVELTRADVSEVMVPRSAIVALPANVSAEAAAQLFRETGRSRIPLYGESRDDIVGIVFSKDLFPAMVDAKDPAKVVPFDLARPAYFVPESKNAFDLMEELRRRRTQLAIVLDEYGGVSGLVTLEDLLEQLVGQIDDEHDLPTTGDPVQSLGGTRYEVDAALPLDRLNERLGLRLPTDEDYQTVGGLAFHALGRIPEAGASFRQHGAEFTVTEASDRAIRRLIIDVSPRQTAEAEH